MFIDFFFQLRHAKIPVTVKEFLLFLEVIAVNNQVAELPTVEDFYYLARMSLIKDEAYFDKFDQVFGHYFKGQAAPIGITPDIPPEWLINKLKNELTPEEIEKIQKMDWGALEKRLRELLEEQKEKHEGGSKWIGTGGSSAFGHSGVNPQGHRIGNAKSGGNKSAIKVWEQRQYKDYDDSVELGTRNLKMALRRLRRFAREGAQTELDLDGTIQRTAANAGYLDIKMVPERHNNIKVIMLLDVGGSMDEHIHRTEQLFSAAKSEFKHMEFFYFHNCVYDFVWRNSYRRFTEKLDTYELIRTFPSDYKLIFVGDGTMSPYEIIYTHGSVEYNNPEAGSIWLQRLIDHFKHYVWLNPQAQGSWEYIESINILQKLLGKDRMQPLTIKGLDQAVQLLNKK